MGISDESEKNPVWLPGQLTYDHVFLDASVWIVYRKMTFWDHIYDSFYWWSGKQKETRNIIR